MLNLYSGPVVGWSMSPTTGTPGGGTSRADALGQRPARTPVILHSDRGCQFTSLEYQRFLKGHHLICSMSAVGSCADNAAPESLFGCSHASESTAGTIAPALRPGQIALTPSNGITICDGGGNWEFRNRRRYPSLIPPRSVSATRERAISHIEFRVLRLVCCRGPIMRQVW